MVNPISSCARAALAYSCTIVILISGLAESASGQCLPVNIASWINPGSGPTKNRIAVSGTLAYLAGVGSRNTFFDVVDVSDPTNPVGIGSLDLPIFPRVQDIAVSGTHVYLAVGGVSGLQVIDVSNPAAPSLLSPVALPAGGGRAIDISGTKAYVAGTDIIQVFDLSNPAVPAFLGSVALPAHLGLEMGVAVSGTTAYVAHGDLGLQVIDVLFPAVPALLGSVGTPEFACDVAVSGTYAFVAAGTFQVIDVSIPTAPVIVGSLNPISPAMSSVTLSGTVAYVGANEGVYVFDVLDPANPIQVGSVVMPTIPLVTPPIVHNLAVSGSTMYAAVVESMTPAHLQVFDIANCTLGACCVDGLCIDQMGEASCLALGGTFLGANASCEGVVCPAACPADLNGDGTVTVIDLLAMLAAWGACP